MCLRHFQHVVVIFVLLTTLFLHRFSKDLPECEQLLACSMITNCVGYLTKRMSCLLVFFRETWLFAKSSRVAREKISTGMF